MAELKAVGQTYTFGILQDMLVLKSLPAGRYFVSKPEWGDFKFFEAGGYVGNRRVYEEEAFEEGLPAIQEALFASGVAGPRPKKHPSCPNCSC